MFDTLRRLIQRRRVARELDDELRFHVEMEIEAHIARGLTPTEARRRALAGFGGVVQAKEAVRDVRTLSIESLWQDVRYAARTLGSNPGFTFAAAGMLALAIGVTTAMFTVVDALILRPVPFRDPGLLVHIWMGTDRGALGGRTFVAPAVVRAWRDSPAFEAAETAMQSTALLETGATVVTRRMATVTPGVFEMLGVSPLLGRLFDASEGGPGLSDRVLVSETVWRTLFDSDPALVGRTVRVDGERLTVVGVLPADFRFPSSTTALWRPTDLNGPGEMARAYARFAPGLPREDALRIATEAAHAADAKNVRLRPWVYPLAQMEDGYSNRAIPLLAGGVVLVFLVLCANVCSLLLARLTTRGREFCMRAALGASRGRLIRQSLAETAVLGTLGIVSGTGVAWLLVSIVRGMLPPALLSQTLNPMNLDGRALAVTSMVGLLATLAAGLLPAWLGTRVDASESLRVVDRSGTETRGARAVMRGLLALEVALVCTLLTGATLLTRSFANLSRADRGLDTSGVTTLWLNLRPTGPGDAGAREALVGTLENELRSLPGVQQVAWSYGVPPGGGATFSEDWIPDPPGAPAVNLRVAAYRVSPEFFSLYGIPILRGRGFASSDTRASVIVSERLAQTFWPGLDPIGRTFRTGDSPQFHVVGLAREIHFPSIDSREDVPEFYWRYESDSIPMVSLRCATQCPDGAVIRHRLAATHPAVTVQDAGPVERRYAAEIVGPRSAAALSLTFAVIALMAAAGGLFSVLSYAVGRRRREFGIRTALGASPAQIRRVVFRDGLVVTVAGLAIGSLFAVLLARTLSALQYGVTASDPVSLLIVVTTVGLTAIVASWRPARMAARVDPVTLLREE